MLERSATELVTDAENTTIDAESRSSATVTIPEHHSERSPGQPTRSAGGFHVCMLSASTRNRRSGLHGLSVRTPLDVIRTCTSGRTSPYRGRSEDCPPRASRNAVGTSLNARAKRRNAVAAASIPCTSTSRSRERNPCANGKGPAESRARGIEASRRRDGAPSHSAPAPILQRFDVWHTRRWQIPPDATHGSRRE